MQKLYPGDKQMATARAESMHRFFRSLKPNDLSKAAVIADIEKLQKGLDDISSLSSYMKKNEPFLLHWVVGHPQSCEYNFDGENLILIADRIKVVEMIFNKLKAEGVNDFTDYMLLRNYWGETILHGATNSALRSDGDTRLLLKALYKLVGMNSNFLKLLKTPENKSDSRLTPQQYCEELRKIYSAEYLQKLEIKMTNAANKFTRSLVFRIL